jgi:hypothetical protein
MLPCHSPRNIANVQLTDSKGISDALLRFAGGVAGADFQDVGRGELRHPASFAARLSAFGVPVFQVVGCRADKPMGGIAAPRMVAVVTDLLVVLQCPPVQQSPESTGERFLSPVIQSEERVGRLLGAIRPALIWTALVHQRPRSLGLGNFPRSIRAGARAVWPALGLHAINLAGANSANTDFSRDLGVAVAAASSVQTVPLLQLVNVGVELLPARCAGGRRGSLGRHSEPPFRVPTPGAGHTAARASCCVLSGATPRIRTRTSRLPQGSMGATVSQFRQRGRVTQLSHFTTLQEAA